MPPAEEVVVRKPEDKRGVWHSLLANNQYNQIATSLEKAHKKAIDHDDVERAALLAAARQLCASCIQLQQEVSFHKEAFHQSETRRDQMDAELNKLLEMVGGGSETAVPGLLSSQENSLDLARDQTPRPKKRDSVWQRLIEFFGFGKEPAASKPLIDSVGAGGDVAGTVPDLTSSPDLRPEEENLSIKDAKRFSSTEERSKEIVRKVDKRPLVEVEGKIDAVETAVPPAISRQQKTAPHLVVYCLGPFRVFQNDQLIENWNGIKGQLILKYLIAHHEQPCVKDILMTVFWPDVDSEAARRNLHQAIYSLRQTLKWEEQDFQHILYENDRYFLNPEMRTWIDCEEFEKHARVGQRQEIAGQTKQAMAEYSVAESLYQGEFLIGDIYEEWANPRREQIKTLYLHVADRLSQHYMERKEYTAALVLCQKLLTQDNCHEAAHNRIMKCYLAQGQRHLAIRQYQTCQQLLSDELDIFPSEETTALYQRITR